MARSSDDTLPAPELFTGPTKIISMFPPTEVTDADEPVIWTKLVLVVVVAEIVTLLKGRLFNHSILSRSWALKSLAINNSPTFQFLGLDQLAGIEIFSFLKLDRYGY